MNNSKIQRGLRTVIKDSELIRKKRLQIAKGATKLFNKKGYFQTSIRDILKATGFTTGNLYNYISKKEDILYLVFDVFHSVWVNSVKESALFEIESPLEQLRLAVHTLLELVAENTDMVRLMYLESKSLPKHYLKSILEKESGLVKCFEKILRSGVKTGDFRVKDPFLMANTIVYLLSIEPLRGWNLKNRYKSKEINKHTEELVIRLIQ